MPLTINATLIILISATIISIIIVAALLPWKQASVLGSPFVYVFKNAGLNSAGLVVNIIVLTSALTSGNYMTYACSRYLWSMAKFDQAPKVCAKTSKAGVPVVALTVSFLFAIAGIISEFVAEDSVYLFLIYFITGSNIFMYTVICICELRFRKRYIAEGGKVEDLKYKVASYPLIPILGICAFVGLFVLSIMDPGQMKGLIICVICYVILYIVSYFYTKKKGIKAANIDI